MTTATQRLEVTLDTLIESVDLAEGIATRVAEAAGFGEEDVHKLSMAVREGAINAFTYGNCQDPQKKITLVVEFEPEKLVIHIMDQGCGFELTEIPDPLAEENLLRTSGRGLFLMRAFTDEFTIQRAPGGGTDLVMAKILPRKSPGNGNSNPQRG
ncbi:MAG: ATP-binding protein [Candidatus Acidiferrales bacterium]